MALFEFSLKPLEKVMPWGEEPNQKLHWFGLTDGINYMNVGKDQLFRSSNDILMQWENEYPGYDVSEVFVDYHVARMYEDLLDILPDIIQQLPYEVHSLISTQEAQYQWESRLWKSYESTESEEVEDLYYQATQWWGNRKLSTLHLSQGPNIWFWRIDDIMHIRWDNEIEESNVIQPWTAVRGEFKLPITKFQNEVKSFHQRLMNDMALRVEMIRTNNPITHINIDIPGLIKEHEERQLSLEKALSQSPGISSWEAIFSANDKLQNINYNSE